MKSASLSLLAALGAGLAGPALGQEVIQAGPQGSPPAAEAAPAAGAPVGDPEQSPEAIGAWAQAVLAGKPTAPEGSDREMAQAGKSSGCTPPEDRKPHGEVWAGIGTGGYRNAGGIVTQPIGDCAQVTVMVDKTEGGFPGWRR